MARSYRHIQNYEKEIKKMLEQGLAHRKRGEAFGFSKEQVKAEIKFMVIYCHRIKYPISAMCKRLDVSRSEYHCYVNRMDKSERDAELAEMIRECQEQTRRTYEYRRVQIWLDRNGIHHNPKTILRVMNKYGLLSVVRRKYLHCG